MEDGGGVLHTAIVRMQHKIQALAGLIALARASLVARETIRETLKFPFLRTVIPSLSPHITHFFFITLSQLPRCLPHTSRLPRPSAPALSSCEIAARSWRVECR